jgi:hypothetical protein
MFDTASERFFAMVEVVYAELKKPKARRGHNGSVREKLLRDSDGRTVRVLSLDANSATFSDDLTAVFTRNVAKARRENKRLFGSANGLQAKHPTHSKDSARPVARAVAKAPRANRRTVGVASARAKKK